MPTGKYFNTRPIALNSPYIGHVVRETDKIVIFGSFGYRFDVPKSEIKEVGRNVILNMDVNELMAYNVEVQNIHRNRNKIHSC